MEELIDKVKISKTYMISITEPLRKCMGVECGDFLTFISTEKGLLVKSETLNDEKINFKSKGGKHV